MFYKAEWEKVIGETFRMKTPSGWLVFDGDSKSCALCHVPDPGHDWKFLPKEEESKDE